MNCKILISPLFILMSAIAPWTLALAAVASTSTSPTAKTETLLNNRVAQNICIDKNGNKYQCP